MRSHINFCLQYKRVSNQCTVCLIIFNHFRFKFINDTLTLFHLLSEKKNVIKSSLNYHCG